MWLFLHKSEGEPSKHYFLALFKRTAEGENSLPVDSRTSFDLKDTAKVEKEL